MRSASSVIGLLVAMTSVGDAESLEPKCNSVWTASVGCNLKHNNIGARFETCSYQDPIKPCEML